MANVFLSHSSADIGWAEQIHRWLSEDKHTVFLDRNRHDGIPAGDDWQARLYERLRWADAVVCVVTPSYLESVWCAAEIGAASALGSELLPVRACAEPLQDRLLNVKQYVDAARDPSDARERLRSRLRVIDGGGGWGWPDDQSPYPGLRPFELGEHRVFFGRAREITQIAERLRSSERAAPAILTVVGPSGCGKSSLIRAGVLPRIAGENYWLALPPMLPGTDPLGGLARAVADLTREQRIPFDVTSLRTDLGRDGCKAIATDLLIAAGVDSQCKLLLVIDQFEELLTQTPPEDRADFVAALQPALGGPVQVLATLRPEFLDALAKDPDLSKLAMRTHQVHPLDSDALCSVIEGPAKIAGLSFEPDLVTRLVTDTGGGDALPLLAFTLEQLAHGAKRGDHLSERRYADIGGVRGALQRQADAALQDAVHTTGVTPDRVASALLGLVTIDEHGRPTKRRVSLDQIAAADATALEPFIERRLLSTQAEGERRFVGVAHEAFLVHWPPLKAEIDAQVTALRARRMVENAANDWEASGRDKRALLPARQLTKATVDIGADLEPVTASSGDAASGRQRRLTPPRWWPGRRRLVTRVDLNDTGEAFLHASIRSVRSRRRHTMMGVIGVIVILAGVAAIAVVGFFQAQANLRAATAQKLIAQAQGMLAGTTPGGDARAFQQILAAGTLTTPDDGVLYTAVVQRASTLKIITGHTGAVHAVAFSLDGRRLASAGIDGTVRLWNPDTGEPIGDPLTGDTGPVGGVAFSPDGHRLASTGADATVRLWNPDTGEPIGQPLTGHTGPVGGVAFSPDGHRLASAGIDATVRLWNPDTGEPIGNPLTGHTDPVGGVAFSPDGHRLASAGYDGTVRLWNPDTGEPIGQPLTGHTDPVGGVAFSPDGHRLASAGYDGTVRLWNPDTGEPIGQPLTGHTGPVGGVAFSPDGDRLATASTDGTVRLWNPDTDQPIGQPLTGHTGEVNGVAFTPDGHRLATASHDGTVRLWNADTGQPLTGYTRLVYGVAFSLDGRRLASAGADATVRLWNPDTGEPIGQPLTGHTGAVHAVAFSLDGRRLASAGAGATVRLWNADTGEPIGDPLTGDTGAVYAVAFSPDGHRLASAGAGATVRLWNPDTGEPIGQPLTGHTGAVYAVAFSPDGHRLASAGAGATVRLWNPDTGEPIGQPLTGHTGAVYAVAFSPDGHRLASAGIDATVRLWNPDTGEPIGNPLTGHTGEVRSVVFSPDGHRLASAGIDATVRLWNPDTGEPIGNPLTGHTGQVTSVAFRPDGHRLASASHDGTVRLWPALATAADLCAKLITNMSDKQWHDWISADIGYIELCPGLPRAPD